MNSNSIGRKILLIEKKSPAGIRLIQYLEEYGFRVFLVHMKNAAEVIEAVEAVVPDIAIMKARHLDFVCRRILSETNNRYSLPLILITEKKKQTEVILGLELGADACMSEPYNPRELIAKMRAVLRRVVDVPNNEREKSERIIEAGGFTLDTLQRTIIKNGEEIRLSGMQSEILKVMMKNSNTILSHKEIMSSRPNIQTMRNYGSIRVHISSLRDKLGDNARNPKWIKTIWGSGYVFMDTQVNKRSAC